MDPLEKLKQEEAELEAQMLGNPTEPQQPEEPEATTVDDGLERTEEELAADEYMMDTITDGDAHEPQQPEYPEDLEEPTEPQPQKPKRTNWKKRFTNYKASTDATINGLRRDLIDMQSANAAVARELQQLQVASSQREVQGDMFEGAFTQEDEDTFGTEGLDVVKKAAKVAIERQVKPLEAELQKQRDARVQDLTRAAATQKRAQYQEFLGRLETLVPEYAELNKDKGFLQWLSGADQYSGYQRAELFRKAEASRDVARVADFFVEYQSTVAPPVPKDVQRQVTPVGRGGGGQQVNPKPKDPGMYRQSDIDKFYSDVMKGLYKDQAGVIAATEAAIEQAYVENRVLKNR